MNESQKIIVDKGVDGQGPLLVVYRTRRWHMANRVTGPIGAWFTVIEKAVGDQVTEDGNFSGAFWWVWGLN